jgi:hypothetical protein
LKELKTATTLWIPCIRFFLNSSTSPIHYRSTQQALFFFCKRRYILLASMLA